MTDAQIIHAIRVAMWRGLLTENDLVRSLAKLSYPALQNLAEQPQTRRRVKAA
jgi:hypothetical protein